MSQYPYSQNQPQQSGTDQTSTYPSAQASSYGHPTQGANHSQTGSYPTGPYGTDNYDPAAQASGSYGSFPAGAAQTSGHYVDSAQDAGFFKALFDFKFEHFITIKFASVLYIIAIIVSILMWIGNTIALFLAGEFFTYIFTYGSGYGGYGGGSSGGGVVLGMISLFLGWIPAVVQILLSRVVLEFIVAGIRTAQNTTKIAHTAH